MDKAIYKYDQIISPDVVVGKGVWLHKLGLPMTTWSHTSEVVSYDEITETIETLNSVYVPA